MCLLVAVPIMAADITITVTVPDSSVARVQAWMNSDRNCLAPLEAGVCTKPKWASVDAMIKDIAAEALKAKYRDVFEWAIENRPDLLPAPVATAEATRKAAETTVKTAKDSVAATVK